jgi:GT2 family glycosyltransferase
VLAQTFRPIEIVIVDDGSTDETARVADELGTAHPEIVRVIHQPNSGVGRAREAGRQAIRGAFVQYLDSDDLLLPRKFELQVAALEAQPECGVAYGVTRYRDAKGNEIACGWKVNNLIERTLFPSLLRARWWETVAPLFRRAVTDAVGPWSELNLEEDWEYDARVAALGVSLAHVPEVLAEHRDHALGRLSRGAPLEPSRLRDRAIAHERILGHALRGGVNPASPEMQQFARELFLIARQCGAAGLRMESQRLVSAARSVSASRDLRLYDHLARVIGWSTAGRLATLADRLRW